MNLLVGFSGSIASYKAPDLVRELLANGYTLEVVATRAALQFTTSTTLETFLNKKLLSNDPFDSNYIGTDHIAKARWAEAILLYGATANTIARIAHGFADDFITLQVLASSQPIFIAPAMNPAMWQSAVVQENIAKLKKRGFIIVGPVEGTVACGETGVGHVASFSEILAALSQKSQSKTITSQSTTLKGKTVLISAGPMQAAIDDARQIQNRSSGQMGLELAKAAQAAGARVRVILGPVAPTIAEAFEAFEIKRYSTASEYSECLEAWFKTADIFVSAAAVLDFEPVSKSKKLSREQINRSSTLPLKIRPVPDFVKTFNAKKAPHQRVVAFALESGNDAEICRKALQKLERKGVDAIVANPLRTGFGPESKNNKVWILSPKGKKLSLGPAPKSQLAGQIINQVAKLL